MLDKSFTPQRERGEKKKRNLISKYTLIGTLLYLAVTPSVCLALVVKIFFICSSFVFWIGNKQTREGDVLHCSQFCPGYWREAALPRNPRRQGVLHYKVNIGDTVPGGKRASHIQYTSLHHFRLARLCIVPEAGQGARLAEVHWNQFTCYPLFGCCWLI